MTTAILSKAPTLRAFLAQEARQVEVVLRRQGLRWDPKFPITLRETLALGLLRRPGRREVEVPGAGLVIARILAACRAGRSRRGRQLRQELKTIIFKSHRHRGRPS